MYDIGFQRYMDYKFRVCGKDSIPLAKRVLFHGSDNVRFRRIVYIGLCMFQLFLVVSLTVVPAVKKEKFQIAADFKNRNFVPLIEFTVF